MTGDFYTELKHADRVTQLKDELREYESANEHLRNESGKLRRELENKNLEAALTHSDWLDKITAVQTELDECRQWNADIVKKAAGGGTLDGYREMGAKCADLERQRDEFRDRLEQMEKGFMYEDVADYEESTGFKVNDAFRLGFDMGRVMWVDFRQETPTPEVNDE